VRKRRLIQIISLIFFNAYFAGIFTGLYQGKLKHFISPGLNCYSCPFAITSCPIGSLQYYILIRAFPFYILGVLFLIGILFGRLVCGYICPFGFLQDILNRKRLFRPEKLPYLRYFVLVAIILIVFFTYEPWFCKICPQGTIQSSLLFIPMRDLLSLIGKLYYFKLFIVACFFILSIISYRPFCTVCPLGTIYSIFNRISIFGIKFYKDKCTECFICKNACKVGLDPIKETKSPACIRCLDCVQACKLNALKFGINRPV